MLLQLCSIGLQVIAQTFTTAIGLRGDEQWVVGGAGGQQR
jgi:hypothetical protein